MKTNRVKAIAWFSGLDAYSKVFYIKTYGTELIKFREPETLTGREIQILWESNQKFAKEKAIELIETVTDIDFIQEIAKISTDRQLKLYRE